MSTRRTTLRLAAILGAAGLCVTGLAACGDDDKGSAPAASSSASASPTASASESSSPSPSPSGSTTTSPVPSASGGDLTARLLPADRMPGFNEVWRWSEGRTGAQRAPFGICQRLTMDGLGATDTVVRRYLPTGDEGSGSGAHLVSSFPDEKSVAQTLAVLRSFHDRCKERLARFGFSRIGAITSVRTAEGTAWWYLLTYSPQDSDEGHFDALGVLASGRTVELVRLDLKGFDYNYERGKEPMVRALRNAAARLS